MKKNLGAIVKLFIIGAIVLVLMGLNLAIGSKIDDRSFTSLDAKREISASAGGSLYIWDIQVRIPYDYIYYNSDKSISTKNRKYQVISMDKLDYKANLISENRTLGIYSTPVFTGDLEINGSFKLEALQNSESYIYYPEEAEIIIQLKDKSLMIRPFFEIDNTKYETHFYSAKTVIPDDISGIMCNFMAEPGTHNFSTIMQIRGAESFNIQLNSGETTLNVKSDWLSPGFTNNFEYLPDTRKFTDDGFTANWHIPFSSKTNNFIGFTFVDPVDVYKKLDRAHSYAFLFIIVPFIILFLFEIFASVNLHPMNYLLCGAASVIFFLLLLSFSEHISFGLSYIIGGIASGLLVSIYVMLITHKIKLGVVMCFIFAGMYAYLYFCLRSEDYALLMGSIFAFILLAVIMFVTRKVDWSNLKKSNHTDLIEA